MTRAKRKKVYLKIASDYARGESRIRGYLCGDLAAHYNGNPYRYYSPDGVTKHFPEFGLFEPKREVDKSETWWQEQNKNKDSEIGGKIDYNCRILCMLFCAEMCK